jgi:outer membrane immunogenic protein
MGRFYKYISTGVLVAVAGFVPLTASADSGFYAGGSIGSATIQADIPDENLGEVFVFDENDFAWKAFGGYNFDLPLVDLGIEAGYVDLGSPSGNLLGSSVSLDVTGWDAFGVAGVQLGPVGVFAKAGLISWNADGIVDGIKAGSDDGSDPAYGIGARFNLGSLEIRGEYEYFDLESTDDVYMLSAGLVYHFN